MGISWVVAAVAGLAAMMAHPVAYGAEERDTGEEVARVFDVPRMDGVKVDGKAEDWGTGGFRVDVMGSSEARFKPSPADFDAGMRLGWNERGLLVLLRVSDSVPMEHSNIETLWKGDCVEMFVAKKRGGGDAYQVQIGPGVDPKRTELRHYVNDRRTGELLKIKPTVEMARTKVEGGYVLEVLLPWANLGIVPKAGETVAFQVYVDDVDANPWERFQAVFYPGNQTHVKPEQMHTLKLAEKPSPPIQAVAYAEYERFLRMKVHVAASAELAGKTVQVLSGKEFVRAGVLGADGGRSSDTMTMPMPAKKLESLRVEVNGQTVALALDDPAVARAKAIVDVPVSFKPTVFASAGFPEVDFERPELADLLIGPYTLKTTFYDADFKVVSKPEKPGRYGAVVEVRGEHGTVLRRFQTLYKTPEPVDWWFASTKATLELPRQMGASAAALREHQEAVGSVVQRTMARSTYRSDDWAVLLAGLATPGWMTIDTTPLVNDPRSVQAERRGMDPATLDRQWWVTLNRKMYGNESRFAQGIKGPAQIDGKPARSVREGTMAEAGMQADAREKLDALLKEWAEKSGEPFTACVVRRGVVVIDKGYGSRDGKAVTQETPMHLASITKVFSGLAMMMMVEEGKANLEDRAGKFLPPLAKRTTGRPVPRSGPLGPDEPRGHQPEDMSPTLGQLFTHTAGTWDLDEEDAADCEEKVVPVMEYWRMGQRHEYNGLSLMLGASVIEQVSGEALARFYQRHIFGPLEMKHTTATDPAGGGVSTAGDIAKIGQLLLNRGTYGSWRFLSEGTFAAMLPHRLVKELGPETQVQWGIGLCWRDKEQKVYGHGSATMSTFLVDPERELVVTMVRDDPGKLYGEYHEKFVEMARGMMVAGK